MIARHATMQCGQARGGKTFFLFVHCPLVVAAPTAAMAAVANDIVALLKSKPFRDELTCIYAKAFYEFRKNPVDRDMVRVLRLSTVTCPRRVKVEVGTLTAHVGFKGGDVKHLNRALIHCLDDACLANGMDVMLWRFLAWDLSGEMTVSARFNAAAEQQ